VLSCLLFLYRSEESHETLDAEISGCVLQLINISDSGFHSKVRPFVSIWG